MNSRLGAVILFRLSGPLILACAASSAAQQQPTSAQTEQRAADPADLPRSGESRRVRAAPSPEELLRALRRSKPSPPVIEPQSTLQGRVEPRPALLLPEGHSVVRATGRLQHANDRWLFVPQPPHDASAASLRQPVALLPNAVLEGIISVHASDPQVLFVLSGEVTVFQGENHLLPRFSTRLTTPPPKDEPGPGTRGVPELVPSDAPAEDVVTKLAELQPTEGLVPARAMHTGGFPVGSDRPATPGFPAVPRYAEGATVVNRPGRVIRGERGWVFVFESDHPLRGATEHRSLGSPSDAKTSVVAAAPTQWGAEPPLPLLPNLNLEWMIAQSAREPSGVVFLVSGETSVFGGQNYLLARAVIQQIDSGNLRK